MHFSCAGDDRNYSGKAQEAAEQSRPWIEDSSESTTERYSIWQCSDQILNQDPPGGVLIAQPDLVGRRVAQTRQLRPSLPPTSLPLHHLLRLRLHLDFLNIRYGENNALNISNITLNELRSTRNRPTALYPRLRPSRPRFGTRPIASAYTIPLGMVLAVSRRRTKQGED